MATPSGYDALMKVCPTLQVDLDEAWRQGNMPTEHMPFAEFLFSGYNQRPIRNMIVPGNGKVRTVETVYQPRLLESLAATNQPNPNCTATNVIGNRSVTNTIDTTVNFQFNELITSNDMITACGREDEHIRSVVERMLDAAERRTATLVSTQAAALLGGWTSEIPFGDDPGEVNNSDQLVLNTLISAGKLNPAALTDLQNALEDSGFPADTMIFGGRRGREWMQMVEAGCCTNEGIDLGELFNTYGKVYGYDKRLQTALGDEAEFIVVAPGALQVLNYSKAENSFFAGQILSGGIGRDYTHTVLRSRRFKNALYDLTAKDTCGDLSLTLTGTFKVIAMPADMYVVGDEYRGVTGAAGGIIVNSWES